MRTDRLAFSAAIALLTACSQSREPAPFGTPTPPTGQVASDLVVHEWGTFTSLSSSSGHPIDGLQHVDEFLPAFVHARSPDAPQQKGMELLPEQVNQKLETPVLYFHTKTPQTVKVAVAFPKGVISEWYPNAASFSPAIDQMTGVCDGQMTWQAKLVPGGDLHEPIVPADSVWAPSRRVAAAGVRIEGPRNLSSPVEDEGFIFYRGLGRFEMPLRVLSGPDADYQGCLDPSRSLVIANDSEQAIGAAFLLQVGPDGATVTTLGAIAAKGRVYAYIPSGGAPVDAYVADASARVKTALVASGLFDDEAQAMVDTWSKSYFRTPGLRVLYLAPRAWTDALLPIEITPAPQGLVRTMIGRVEVMTQAEEQAVVARVLEGARSGTMLAPDSYGRFTEAKLRRAAQLINDPDAQIYLASAIALAAAQP